MDAAVPVLRRVVSARLRGAGVVPLTLGYRVADPLVITLGLGGCRCDQRTWHVARRVVTAALLHGYVGDHASQCASRVQVMRPFGFSLALVGLRDGAKGWLMTVPVVDLAGFAAATYEACPAQREALLLSKELDAHIGLFHAAHGGGNPG